MCDTWRSCVRSALIHWAFNCSIFSVPMPSELETHGALVYDGFLSYYVCFNLISSCTAGVIGGCADDVGVVFKSLVHLIPLSEIFGSFSAASGMDLKPVKLSAKLLLLIVPGPTFLCSE